LNTGKKIGSGPARNATGINELDQLSWKQADFLWQLPSPLRRVTAPMGA
jgi:hypothetical protein